MATKIEITKGGVKLINEVSTHPRPTPRQAYPIPNFPSDGTSLLTLTLEKAAQTGRTGIRVQSIPDKLPGSDDAVWVLWHAAYQGASPPVTLTYEQLPVSGPKINLFLDNPLPRAVHLFHLVRTEAGQDTAYPESSITTPDDALAPLSLEGILADDLISTSEKPSFKAYYDLILAEQPGLDTLATFWLITTEKTAYDSAITALTVAVTALSPAYTDMAHENPLGAGGGITLLNLFLDVYSKRDVLKAAIQTAISGGTGDVWSDDKLTVAEKRQVKAWRDDIKNEQTGANGLDALASKAGVSATAYDAAITTWEAWLDALTGTDGWNPTTHDWRNYTASYFLGTGNGATGRTNLIAVYSARTALLNAIRNASLDPGIPTETMRPVLQWDFSGATLPATPTVVTSNVSPTSADDGTTSQFSGAPQISLPFGPSTSIGYAGNKCYIVQARVKFVSGTWLGRCSFDGTSPAVSIPTKYKDIAAPATGVWTIVSWDMRALTVGGTDYTLNSLIQKIRLDLATGSSVVLVDWVAVGTYGAGSRYDYDMMIQDGITDLLARAGTSVFSNVVVANTTNLFPNPDSEILPESAGGKLSDSAIGAVGIPNNYTANQHSGLRCREIKATTPVTVTPRYAASAGDVYYLAAWISGYSPGTPTITIKPYNASGTALTTQTLTGASGAYQYKSMQFTLPSGTASFELALHNAGGDGLVPALFDEFILRKAVDAYLLVAGTVGAIHVVAGSMQTYHMAVGPYLQFRANAGGLALVGRPDGTISRVTAADRTANPALPAENASDAEVYIDDSRLFPSGDVGTYEATFQSDTGDRGFIFNLGSAFATSGQAGIRVTHSGTTIKVYGVNGIGNYSSALKTVTVPATTTHDTLTALYYPTLQKDPTGAATIRLRVLLNGVSVLTMTDAELTASYNGARGGYAGLKLGSLVRVFDPKFGRGYVTIQDGAVKADIFMSSDYAEDGSGNPTAGFKAGFGQATPLKCGPNGLQIGTAIFNQASARFNRAINGNFINNVVVSGNYRPHNWNTWVAGDGTTSFDWFTGQPSYSILGNVAALEIPFTANNQTKTLTTAGSLTQAFTLATLAPDTVYHPHLKFKVCNIDRNGHLTAATSYWKVVLRKHRGADLTPVDYTIDTFTLTGYSNWSGLVASNWTSKDYDVYSTLATGGTGLWELIIIVDANTTVTCDGSGNGFKAWISLAEVLLEI